MDVGCRHQVDINIIGKRETRYTAVPSDVTLKEHNESVAEINFSFQSEYGQIPPKNSNLDVLGASFWILLWAASFCPRLGST